MNDLIEQFGSCLKILCFPCNQFGHQENGNGVEISNALRYVRPGNNFEPKAEIFEKVDVNGAGAHQVFQFLKSKIPFPADSFISFIKDPKYIIWSPVTRSDLAWNFEKFLVDTRGRPVIRYSHNYDMQKICCDINNLLS